MVIENEIPNLFDWLPGAALQWLLVAVFIAVAGVLLSLVFAIVSRGPAAGFRSVTQRMLEATGDLVQVSPRRVLALSVLAFREAFRRKALYAGLALFAVILMFAAWFLEPSAKEPVKLYLSFVLKCTTYLVLLIGLVISAFSLPLDISKHTIYTVVTKPVRPTEIVLGRIFGFSALGTMMLIVMGLISFVFVGRQLDHTHEIDVASLERVVVQTQRGDEVVFQGETSNVYLHYHDFTVNVATGEGRTSTAKGHHHKVTQLLDGQQSGEVEDCQAADGDPQRIRVKSPGHGLESGELIRVDGVRGVGAVNGLWIVDVADDDHFDLRGSEFESAYEEGGTWTNAALVVDDPDGHLIARVPIYAVRDREGAPLEERSFRFIDREGVLRREGINVGNEWTYRSYIDGGTPAAALWQFEGIREEDFPEDEPEFAAGVPVEMTLSVFRTHKGDIESGVLGGLTVINPETGARSATMNFTAREFSALRHIIPRKLRSGDPNNPDRTLDFFDDLVAPDGRVVLEIRCLAPGQYFGMAKPDLYFLARDASYQLNFFKGYVSIWLQLILVIACGVMFSTFLNEFVAMVATAALLAAGFFRSFISSIGVDEMLPGGGPFESMLRILTRAPMTTPLEPGVTTTVVKALDFGAIRILHGLVNVLPDMGALSDVEWVAKGYDIPAHLLGIQVFSVLAFFVPLFVLGHYILKGREVAK